MTAEKIPFDPDRTVHLGGALVGIDGKLVRPRFEHVDKEKKEKSKAKKKAPSRKGGKKTR
ncbi:MAG: hypothetical protein AAB778_02890 [Patescibacteria group bacterium]